jgi:hypothetical protein
MFSTDLRWVVLFGAVITGMAAFLSADVYLKLATVRSLIVFVTVDGMTPPICGFCVLGF